MSAGFGWSVSDVIILAKLARRVYNALKEDGGAVTEFEDAMTSLSNLQLILEPIQTILESVKPGSRAALAAQLERSMCSITDFHSKLLKTYGKKLDSTSTSSRNPLRSVRYKIRWELLDAKDVAKFQERLDRDVQSFQLLLLSQLLLVDIASSSLLLGSRMVTF
jgi:hypothetical protein